MITPVTSHPMSAHSHKATLGPDQTTSSRNVDSAKKTNESPQLEAALDNQSTLAAILWATLEKIGAKQLDHNALAEDSQHELALTIVGHVDGQSIMREVSSLLSIGRDQTKATSVTPQQPQLIAYILSKLNQQTRDKILQEVPLEFADNDCHLPEPDEQLITLASEFLKKLRARKTTNSRRPIRCQFACK